MGGFRVYFWPKGRKIVFGLRALIGDRLLRRSGGGCCGDASAALFDDCYESPGGSCGRGGCEPEGFCYSATPRSNPYYAGRNTYFAGGGGLCRGFLGGLFGGLFGGLIGRLISRFGGGGGGGWDGGGCDDGELDDSGFEDYSRDDRQDERYDRLRREDFELERLRNRDRQRERDREEADGERERRRVDGRSDRNQRAESVVDEVKGVSNSDKQRAKSMSSFEEESLRMINDFRRKNGLAPVDFDPRLQLIALVHSKYQDAHGLGHDENRPGWQSPGQRMRQVGLKGWAENSAYGSLSTPRQLVQMWIDSPGHRRALLDPNVRIAGISKYGKGATLDLV